METFERIRWIDDVKVVAGILMLVDHGLLYFGGQDSWIRYILTRCVEPRHIFAFGYLAAARPKSFSWIRWGEVGMAAVLESLIHRENLAG